VIFVFFYTFYKKKNIEHFEEMIHVEIEDKYDMEFVELYDIIYNDFQDIDYDYKLVKTKTLDTYSSPIKIAVLGCGVGKVCKKIKENYKDVHGVDISENMLRKAQLNTPNIKYIHGDIRDSKLYSPNSLSHIWIDERTLYSHPMIEKEKIMSNCYQWLKEDGYIMVSLYHPDKLQLAARYYSSNYIDSEKNLHGFTYLNYFSHDCYYIPQNIDNSHLHYYYDKITLDTGNTRIVKSSFYIEPIEDIYDMIFTKGFETVHIEPVHLQIVGGYDFVILKKRKLTTTVEQLERLI